MTIEEVIRVIGSIEIVLTAILANAFCILYQIKAPWWKSEVGRNIMILAMVIAGVIDVWIVALIFGGDNVGFRLLRLAAFAFMPYVLARRIWILLKAQSHVGSGGRRDKDEVHGSGTES